MRAVALLLAVAAFDWALVWAFNHSSYWRSPEEQAQRKAQHAAWLRSRN